ncbi:uncharacterized protein TRUGW13939_03158 [Talaromyces rugulosus]|uniref:C2H2-type domain-containing protein n=1 Tax=Talaromyces rugulosus TaxID=121627 RepID=A0A7H8QQ99_TALRU|nr:uncharacterized protein TRUGW13939_03158 [Talaromyces rugulosus]QKX56058.1 hypothetical protein TRUGW13939_03158 [Talaromyces rugulosus]
MLTLLCDNFGPHLMMSSGPRSTMRSILNNDDNPSFAVRKNADSSPQQFAHENRYHNADYSESGTARPSHLTQQQQTPIWTATPTSTTREFRAQPQPYPIESSISPLPALHSRQPSLGSNDGLTTPTSPLEMEKKFKKNKYACPYAKSHSCTATFTTSGHAARHGKKHTGEKSVHCPICNKAFTRKDNMKQHRRIHKPTVKEPSSPESKGQNNSDQEHRDNSQPESDGEDTSAGSSPAQSN